MRDFGGIYSFVLLNELHEISSRTVLEQNPKVVFGFIPGDEFHDVRVVHVVDDLHFIENSLLPTFVKALHRHVLDGFLLPSLLPSSPIDVRNGRQAIGDFVDDRELAFADFLVNIVVVHSFKTMPPMPILKL